MSIKKENMKDNNKREEMENKIENMTSQNSVFPRCVDGRSALAFIEWDEVQQKWIVSKRNKEAAVEVGPQFLGSSLLFVRALQEIAGVELSEAFDLVERASKKLGRGLQVHLDDHHGEANLEEKTEEEILQWFEKQLAGCGFAQFAWGDKAGEIIALAKSRHWRVQILAGDHKEGGAIINYQRGQTFDTSAGVNQIDKDQKSGARFNTEIEEAREMFEVLGEMIEKDDFVDKAMVWNIETYQKVVVALGGVKTAEEIEINK